MPAKKPKLNDLRRGGEEALVAHLLARADEALVRHGGPLTHDSLQAFLSDTKGVRFPVRLVYDATRLEAHQFAQPERDPVNPEGMALYLHPALASRPDLLPLVVAYYVPVINYGPVVTHELAERFGARVLGLNRQDYYQRLCGLADELGLDTAESKKAAVGAGLQTPKKSKDEMKAFSKMASAAFSRSGQTY